MWSDEEGMEDLGMKEGTMRGLHSSHLYYY